MMILRDNIIKLQNKYEMGHSIESLIDEIVRMFQIRKYIEDKYLTIEEVEERLKSIGVLKSFVKNNTLETFLSYVYMGTNTKKKKKKDCVKLMTIHGSKGLEFENVFVIGVEEGKFPHEKADILEEARLFYVAVTRPEKRLWVCNIGEESQFIGEYTGEMLYYKIKNT